MFQGQDMKVLIADDDTLAQLLLRRCIEECGHDAVVYGNGEEAWKSFDANPVRLIISDWMMPGMNGLEFCRRVRKRLFHGYTYFILITAAKVGQFNFTKALEAEVDDFLRKPLDFDEIKMRLCVAERILGLTRQIDQLKQFVPICSYCKKIRSEDNSWHQIENYILRTSGHHVSHGICPDCYDLLLPPKEED